MELGDVEHPRVVVAVGTSVDSRVTLSSDRLLLDEATRRVWDSLQPQTMRAVADARGAQIERAYQPQAVLEGSGTFVTSAAGPLIGLPTDAATASLYADFLPDEVVHDPGREKWFTVVDGRGRVRWRGHGENGFRLLVLVAAATPSGYLSYLRQERIPYLVAGKERVDLAAALRRMASRLGVTCVVSQAGGGLNGALLRAGLIDELHLLVFPALIGGKGTPTLVDGPELAGNESPTPLHLVSAHAQTDGTLWLHYEVVRAAGEKQ